MGKAKAKNISMTIDGKKYALIYVEIGNPHAILFVDNYEFDYRNLGKKIENNKIFPNKVNVEFIKVNSREDIDMRVWERGSGETRACGTGASASVFAAAFSGKAGNKATVHLLGGDLEIMIGKSNVYMTGPAELVFEGEVDI